MKKRDDGLFKDIIDDDVYRTDFKCKKIKKKPDVKEKKKDSDSENDSEDNDSSENESSDKDKKKEEGIFSFFDLL